MTDISNYVNVTLTFLNRVTLNGQEADTLVAVKQWLLGMVPPRQPNVEAKEAD